MNFKAFYKKEGTRKPVRQERLTLPEREVRETSNLNFDNKFRCTE